MLTQLKVIGALYRAEIGAIDTHGDSYVPKTGLSPHQVELYVGKNPPDMFRAMAARQIVGKREFDTLEKRAKLLARAVKASKKLNLGPDRL